MQQIHMERLRRFIPGKKEPARILQRPRMPQRRVQQLETDLCIHKTSTEALGTVQQHTAGLQRLHKHCRKERQDQEDCREIKEHLLNGTIKIVLSNV